MTRFSLNTRKKSNNIYRYYSSIDFLPIIWFFKVIETGDNRFLLKIEDKEVLPEIEDTEFLEKAWDKIESQYSKSEGSNSAMIQFVTGKGLHKLELEYLMLWNIQNLMIAENNGPNTKECLIKAGLKGKDLKWIQKRIKVLTNKINLKKEKVEELPKGKKDDYWRVLDEISNIRGYKINPFKTTVREYITIKQNIKNGKGQDREKGRN